MLLQEVRRLLLRVTKRARVSEEKVVVRQRQTDTL